MGAGSIADTIPLRSSCSSLVLSRRSRPSAPTITSVPSYNKPRPPDRGPPASGPGVGRLPMFPMPPHRPGRPASLPAPPRRFFFFFLRRPPQPEKQTKTPPPSPPPPSAPRRHRPDRPRAGIEIGPSRRRAAPSTAATPSPPTASRGHAEIQLDDRRERLHRRSSSRCCRPGPAGTSTSRRPQRLAARF